MSVKHLISIVFFNNTSCRHRSHDRRDCHATQIASLRARDQIQVVRHFLGQSTFCNADRGSWGPVEIPDLATVRHNSEGGDILEVALSVSPSLLSTLSSRPVAEEAPLRTSRRTPRKAARNSALVTRSP